MSLSKNSFSYEGIDEFDLNFTLGYSSAEDISCYVDNDNPIDVPFDWLTDSRVRIDPSEVSYGDTISFVRTVSKTTLPYDLLSPGKLSRETIHSTLLHTVYMMHELLDGRVLGKTDLTDATYDSVNTAVAYALDNFLFKSLMTRDILIRSSFESANNTETMVSGGDLLDTSAVVVRVLNPPSVTTEFVVYDEDKAVFSVTINSSGEEVSRSEGELFVTGGLITTDVVGGNYSSGADLFILLPLMSEAFVNLSDDLSDYTGIFNAALQPVEET